MRIKFASLILLLPIFLTLTSCGSSTSKKIQITSAKIVTGVDDKLMPIKIIDIFPKNSTSVFCWLHWKNAQLNTPIIASWHYLTDDIHILDYTFIIPRRNGTGSVSLTMPNDKPLPSGDYRLDLKVDNKILKTLTFKIAE